MTTNNDTPVETTATQAEVSEPVKFFQRPFAKKALIWGGVALGVVVGAIILTRGANGEYEEDLIVEEIEYPDGTVKTTVTPVTATEND